MSDTAQTSWPDRALLFQLVQAPSHHFDDPDLQTSTFTRGRRGTPMAWSGGRAIVFQARDPNGRPQAVRFYLAPNQTAQARYEAIARHIRDTSGAVVETEWRASGLVLTGQRYPLLKMRWIEGDPLDKHLDSVVGEPRASDLCLRMAEQWRKMCAELRSRQIAHGDIHAGNILVEHGAGSPALRLVDYDSMWVPGLDDAPREDGHPAFRHPGHDASDWGPDVDAFANALVYLALRGLAADVTLWRFHEPDDKLLFTKDDLSDPHRDVWWAVQASPDPEVRSLADTLVAWLGERPLRYRSLEDALAEPMKHAQDGTNVWPPRPASRSDDAGTQAWGPPTPRPRERAGQPASPSAHADGPQQWGQPARPADLPAGPQGVGWLASRPGLKTALIVAGVVLGLLLLGLLLSSTGERSIFLLGGVRWRIRGSERWSRDRLGVRGRGGR